MTDPLRKPIAGEPFVPSAKQTGMFIEAALRSERASQELRGLISEPDSGVVLVRNDTGTDIDEPHAVLAVDTIGDGVLIEPAERGSVVHERPAFSGQVPDSLTESKRIAILQQPLKAGAIGKAVASGVSWVKIRGAGLGFTDENLYANPVDTETGFLEAGGAGPAKVLWHDETSTQMTSGWAVVALGVDAPPLVKVVIVDEPTTFPNQLIEGSGNPASALLLLWDETAGEWMADPVGPPLQVYPDPGFRGVAFVDDALEVYYSRESNRWQAVNGGHRIINAVPKDGTSSSSGFTAYAFGLSLDVMEIPITIVADGGLGAKDAIELMGDRQKQFTAVWRNDLLDDPSSPEAGIWTPVADWKTGCSLLFRDCKNDPGDPCSSESIELQLNGTQVAGKGLAWDDEACELKLDSTQIDCTDLATAIPCCEGLCERLDQIEEDIDELFDCCEANTECCRFVLDHCCDELSSSGSDGSGKDTAIVPASWAPGGYTALFVEECPEVRFDDVITVEIPQGDCTVAIDPKYLEVCEPDSIEVCGTSCDLPVAVGARVEGGLVRLRFAEQRDEQLRVVIRLTGIRKGFAGVRFPDRTRADFDANERWLRRGTNA